MGIVSNYRYALIRLSRNCIRRTYVHMSNGNGKSHILTTDNFDERMDELMHEVVAMREEQILHQGQHDEIVERLERIEQKAGLEPL